MRRFSKPEYWLYIDSKNMIADKGTRKGCSLKDVDQDSVWINGYNWTKKDSYIFPAKSVKEIALNQTQMQELKKEMSFCHC